MWRPEYEYDIVSISLSKIAAKSKKKARRLKPIVEYMGKIEMNGKQRKDENKNESKSEYK